MLLRTKLIFVFILAVGVCYLAWLFYFVPRFRRQGMPAQPTNFPPSSSKIKLLFIFDKELHDTIMDRWFVDYFHAAQTLPSVEATIWGIGWAGYNTEYTLEHNMMQHFGSLDKFDFVVFSHYQRGWYKHEKSSKLIKGILLHECFFRETDFRVTPSVQLQFEEKPTYYRACLNLASQYNVSFMAYANDMPYYASFSAAKRLVYHLPLGVDLKYFQPTSEVPLPTHKTEELLLVGKIAAGIYPFRYRIASLIEQKKIPGSVHQHPGYIEVWSKEERDQKNITIDYLEKQIYKYSRAMQAAKIVICTHSVREVAVRKYIEAAAAGALVMGNLPHEREQEFGEFVVEIDDADSDEKIIDTIAYWLRNDELRNAKIAKGLQFAQKYSAQNVMLEMIYGFQQFEKGVRGLFFNYPFRDVSYRMRHVLEP